MLTKAGFISTKIPVKLFLLNTTVFYLNMFLNVIYSCDRQAEFSASYTPVELKSS